MNPEKMRPVADDRQPSQPIGTGDHGNPARRLFGIAAMRLGDDGLLGCAHPHQVCAAHGTLGVLVAARSAQRDNQRCDPAMIEVQGVIQPRAINRRGPAVVLRRAKNSDRVRRRSLVLVGIGLNLHVNPAAPAHRPRNHRRQQQQRQPKSNLPTF